MVVCYCVFIYLVLQPFIIYHYYIYMFVKHYRCQYSHYKPTYYTDTSNEGTLLDSQTYNEGDL